MARIPRASETPATTFLRRHEVDFSLHPYVYVERGGAQAGAEALGLPLHAVVKTLVMQDERAAPLLVLMHGDYNVSTRALARQAGARQIEPCRPEVAQRMSGYLVGGTSPFATRRTMPVYLERSILGLSRIYVNGGRRGLLVGIEPEVCVRLLGAVAVDCALEP